jgi:hypothetical protein
MHSTSLALHGLLLFGLPALKDRPFAFPGLIFEPQKPRLETKPVAKRAPTPKPNLVQDVEPQSVAPTVEAATGEKLGTGSERAPRRTYRRFQIVMLPSVRPLRTMISRTPS